jgi:antitoxin FitA
MANLTIKNLPDDVYEGLKAAAQERRQSLNGYLLELLATEQILRLKRAQHREAFERIRRRREQMEPIESAAGLLREARDESGR